MFKKGDYIVFTKIPKSVGPIDDMFPANYVFKQLHNSESLYAVGITGKTSNFTRRPFIQDVTFWRYANDYEKAEYDEYDRPCRASPWPDLIAGENTVTVYTSQDVVTYSLLDLPSEADCKSNNGFEKFIASRITKAQRKLKLVHKLLTININHGKYSELRNNRVSSR